MKKTVLILAIAIVMIGCIGCDQQKEKTASNRFPGFTQIGSTGEWSKLYLDLNSAQKEGLTVTFKFIQVVEGGYVIQEGATDCRNNFLRRDGVQYKDDGTSDRKYPGDAAPMPYQNQPGIPELVRVACNKTGLPPAPAAEQPAEAPAPAPMQTQAALPTPTTNTPSGNTDGDLREYVESITASSSTHDNTHDINYSPSNLWDNKDVTAWAIDLKKDPNPNFVIRFKEPVVITGMKLIPGYKKFMIVDRYLQNHKLKRISITYANTSVQDEFTFDQVGSYQALTWQYKATKNQIVTQSVTVKVLETYPGITQGNRSASSDLCVSEFHFLGHLAGGNR